MIRRDVSVWAKELKAAYHAWCEDYGVKEQSQHKLGKYLTSKGFGTDESSGRTKRLGIALKETSDLSDLSDLSSRNSYMEHHIGKFLEKGQKRSEGQKFQSATSRFTSSTLDDRDWVPQGSSPSNQLNER